MTARQLGAPWRVVFVAVVALMPAFAQAQDEARWQLAGGLRLVGTVGLGQGVAVQTGNNRAPLLVFASETDLARSAGWLVLLGRRVREDLQLEVMLSLRPTALSTHIVDDIEAGGPRMAEGSLTELQWEGGVRWSPTRWRFTPRTRAFVSGGGGYVRHVYEGRTLVETGASLYVGGGVLRSLWRGASGRTASARIEGRAVGIAGGAAFDGTLRAAPALTAAAQLGF